MIKLVHVAVDLCRKCSSGGFPLGTLISPGGRITDMPGASTETDLWFNI